MSTELREYRKRISLTGAPRNSLNNGLPPYLANNNGLGSASLSNPNDVSFQFEFPKFGFLPGPPKPSSINTTKTSSQSPVQQTPSPLNRSQVSPVKQAQSLPGAASIKNPNRSPSQVDGGDMSSLSGLFSPSLLESVSKSPSYDFFGQNGTTGSRSSTDSIGQMSTGHNTSYSSPSASSNSNHGPSSSCGTSPEPTMQSPVYKSSEATLTTIGEEQSNGPSAEGELTFCDKLNMACGNPNNPIPRTMSESSATSGTIETPAFDITGIDWFAQQNGNQFDPQLFGDYREPQENILAGDAFGDSFFADAYALPDFNSPFNLAPSPSTSKKDLVAQIDEKLEGEEVVPGEDPSKLLTCNTIWYGLQYLTMTL